MKIDDILLLSYVDGALSVDQKQQVEEGIGSSAELAERVALLRASRLPYQHAFAHQKLPEVPESLVALVGRIAHGDVDAKDGVDATNGADAKRDIDAKSSDAEAKFTYKPHASHWAQQPSVGTSGASGASGKPSLASALPAARRRAFRVAPAWLAVAFVAGAFCWGAGFRLAADSRPAMLSGLAFQGPSGTSPWVLAAAGYQQLYAHETLAEIQPDMAQSARTIDQIRREDGIDVHVPDLSESGLQFKRVQRLSFHGKPLVQIVYLPTKGAPVALCVIKEVKKPDHAIAQQDIEDMSVVTWRRDEVGYALIGKRDGVSLPDLGRKLAENRGGQLFGKAALDSLLAAMT
jgi:anti-sigma factor RsiW